MKWLVVLVLLVCGCLSQQTLERFVCGDGWVTDSPDGCVGHERPCPRCQPPACKCPSCNSTVGYACTTATVEGATSTTAAVESDDSCTRLGCPGGTAYVASKTSAKYHRCDCRFATTLSAKNRMCFSSTDEAEAAGKQPCGICAKG